MSGSVRIWTSSRLDPLRNVLLASLGPAELDALVDDFEPVSLDYREVLYRPGEPIAHVYFPVSGLISIVGLPVYLGVGSDPLQAFAQVPPCLALRMPAERFREAVEQLSALDSIMRRYLHWAYASMAQWVLCARLHPVEERIARWLLMCHDRVSQDSFAVTHECLAEMLGVRRATITLAVGMLQRAGVAMFRRGMVTILDRAALEAAACECYRVVAAEYVRLLGRPP